MWCLDLIGGFDVQEFVLMRVERKVQDPIRSPPDLLKLQVKAGFPAGPSWKAALLQTWKTEMVYLEGYNLLNNSL